MSGHSKWHQIKRQKEAADFKRSQAFTRLSTHIKQAAQAGRDPATNPALAEAIARATHANMPRVNIDRLLQASSRDRRKFFTLEAFGPAGSALLILGRTDNSRRTTAELRAILKKFNGHLGAPGSAAWKFTPLPKRQYAIKYPHPISPDHHQQLKQLKTALDKHPDIEQVFTDAVE
ncbi:MAG: YebC/PmpR family DNA-binding transcriptional regulator [Candidatus Andersenbacteria bacterium]|nr:YebC/PmpR family DNA-binding transcriptional regulator [Candidatus Andersenbacteria bacterium]